MLRMRLKLFGTAGTNQVSYRSPATIVDDAFMRARSDLSCGTWASEINGQQIVAVEFGAPRGSLRKCH